MASAGWYPDPAGSPHLRFYDGQIWTTAMAPPPVAPRPYAPAVQQGFQPQVQQTFAPQLSPGGQQFGVQPAWRSSGSSGSGFKTRGSRFYATIARTMVAAVAIAVAAPLLLSGHSEKPATVANFTAALLTPGEISATAGGTFVVEPNDSNDSNANSKSNCPAADAFTADTGTVESAGASRSFSNATARTFVEETLGKPPGKAQVLIDGLKNAAATCSSFTDSDGSQNHLSRLPDPAVKGSDATVAIQAIETDGKLVITADIYVARFGDRAIVILYGGTQFDKTLGEVLLQQAASKAKDVL